MRLFPAAMLLVASCSVPPVAAVNGGPNGPDFGPGGEPGDFGPGPDLSPPACADDNRPILDGPAPISGGTLIGLGDGRTVVASDPDLDAVFIVDMQAVPPTINQVPLTAHDEPGRLAVDGAGKVHVVLRRAGAVATIDPTTHTLLRRDAVCPAPRGIAYDSGPDLIHVACVGGELISLPATGGSPTRTVQLDPDLRDVLVINGTLMVTRFRAAELLTLKSDGSVASRTSPQAFTAANGVSFTPSVAWRTIATPSGGVAMLHQRATTATISVTSSVTPLPPPDDFGVSDLGVSGGSGYGSVGMSNCTAEGAVVHSALSVLSGTGANLKPGPFADLILVVDVAVTTDGSAFAVVSASPKGNNVATFTAADGFTEPTCMQLVTEGPTFPSSIAVVALDNSTFVVQGRSPSALWRLSMNGVFANQVILGDANIPSAAQELFHSNTGANIACASCHPEGGDDGRVWQFDVGPRRTMSLRGGLRGTEPLHWPGDEDTFGVLMEDVFTGRMHGGEASCETVNELSAWLESLPAVPASVSDPAAVARGKTLFESQDSGCADCHNGPHLTNNINADVGTGAFFNVPRLVELAQHAPYLHDGRAATLRDRFDPSIGGGDKHGNTSQLTSSQIDDLVAYLSSL